MKTIGLLGGMTWHSTMTSYRILNTVINKRLGGQHSAKCLLYSVDFAEFEVCLNNGEWGTCAEMLRDAAQKLEQAGADIMLLCTNTMHKVAEQVQSGISIPLLHIAEVTADALLAQGVKKVALLGTRYTMQQDFYTKRLQSRGIDVLLPNAEQVEEVHRIIFEELTLGKVLEMSKQYYLDVLRELAAQGAQGAILGCTEIGMLLQQADTALPLFDTTELHAEKAALWVLA